MRTTGLVLVVLLGFGAAAQAGEPISDGKAQARLLYERGMKHYNVGEYREALTAFKDAYFAKPDPVFLFNMGQCYRQLGQPEDAVREYRAYLRESPDAINRAEVEGLIAAGEEQIRHQNAAAPPTGVLPALPNPTAPPLSAPRSASTAALTAPPPPPSRFVERHGKHTWLWIGLGAAAAAVVAAVAIGIAYAVPNDAGVQAGTDGSRMVTFP